jgi:ABC-type oligopeptide transport system substrate-binding subunit
MKNLFKITAIALVAITFTVAACDSKPAKNVENATEETMDAAGAEMDSATTPAEGDTAVVRDQPTNDGLVDSIETK